MSEAPKPNIFPLILPTTEVLSDLRLEAYRQVAKELGGVSIQVVAEPGDIMTVAGSGAPKLGNYRDRGTLLGVNGAEIPEHVTTHEVPVEDGHKGVVVKLPARYHELREVSTFSRHGFYEQTNATYKSLRAKQRAEAASRSEKA